MRELSKAIPDKPDPFTDAALGEWKPDKKSSNKDILAFRRSGELMIAERYAQDWIDPVSFKKKKLYGKVFVTEMKLINKKTSELSYNRSIEPCVKGGIVEDAIPDN